MHKLLTTNCWNLSCVSRVCKAIVLKCHITRVLMECVSARMNDEEKSENITISLRASLVKNYVSILRDNVLPSPQLSHDGIVKLVPVP